MLGRKALVAVMAVALVICAVAAGKAEAAATPGFSIFKATPTDTQAGGHPDVKIDLEVNIDRPEEDPCAEVCLAFRRIALHWPSGFIGNPHATPKCTLTDFNQANCPAESQVGRFTLASFGGEESDIAIFVPLYNMETNPNQAGLLGFTAPFLNFPIFFELSGRTDSDYGLDAITTPQVRLGFNHFITTIWGIPQSSAHDKDRFITPLTGVGACYEGIFAPGIEGCPPGGEAFVSPTYAKSTAPEIPFLQNPTTCGVSLTMTGDVEYYGGPHGHAESAWPATTGCQQASFDPSLVAKPTTPQTDTASGLDTDLRVPQTQSPITPSPSEMRATRITLPEGFTINPNAADGKIACPETQTAVGTLFAAVCPEFSKIGSLTLDVAALPAPIPGAMYLLEPQPGNRYRVLIAADGFATHVKLIGSVHPDPSTGQLILEFNDLPQAPLQEFNVHIFGSERGLFATPDHCGTYPVKSEFVPWNNTLTIRQSESFMTFDSGPNGSPCESGPLRFSPGLSTGTATSTAAAHSPLSLVLDRNDGEQTMTGVTVKTPPGFAATLKGVPYCPEAAIDRLNSSGYPGLSEQANAACPSASQVGSANAGAGAGTHPIYVGGKVFLAGPYKGSPLSLEVVLPAVSGPYDLGVIAVRVALDVDPVTAQVTAKSDPLPQILEGIPLRTRYIRVNLDRPAFTLNPTNCDEFSIAAGISGDEGGFASPSRRFQATNCSDLPYEPKLSLTLSGGLKRRGHPAVTATFTAQPGEANTRLVQVTLPKGELLDNAHIGTICTRVDFARDSCPAESKIGTATASTPLLDDPLRGDVVLRPNPAHKLPDLVLDLEGQFDIELAAKIDTVKGGSLRTTFESLPDAAVSSFTLKLAGGSKGLLQNSKSLCGKPKRATARMVGQNGATLNSNPKLKVNCSGNAKRKRHNGKAGR
ncbi:MAG TPA: hypothetical protein VIT85_03555 [Solirubrobacterales bacterium]